jgi:nicotianamine synthase
MNINTATSSVRDRIVQFDHIISQLDIFDPCPAVNNIFEQLVVFCCSTQMPSLTFERLIETDPVFKASCEHLSSLLSDYEYQLEKYWAETYAFGEHPIPLENFPDIDDYRRSIRLEMNVLQGLGIRFAQSPLLNNECSSVVTKIIFIGSGPLPVSSMLILSEYAPFVDVYNIDKSHEANQLASIVCQRLLPAHLFKRMHFITCDINRRPLPFE